MQLELGAAAIGALAEGDATLVLWQTLFPCLTSHIREEPENGSKEQETTWFLLRLDEDVTVEC